MPVVGSSLDSNASKASALSASGNDMQSVWHDKTLLG
jgi:hypothetical protein